ncbi:MULTISPECIES: type II toxin-antitoxin system PemK/MazF family toxin [Pseudomonas]|uniref:type II toxin-antitoxin system PemK/MazF family toxin n=1 Tax=Pseudomonas TaxID=286 RepID=UPI0009DB2AB3|nr:MULTISPECIES: type II toxin-antitoxin system PemK/MazF family toxin [Pseudomonas]MDC7830322.1 type II toxin-antitoxin system PemK/MazF family toxin [Pseudomonas benzopyrenica]
MAKPFYPLPAPGDIVWCKFPSHANLGEPGPKSRPALVVRVSDLDHEVVIAYGTSQKTQTLYPGEFSLSPSDGDAYQMSGLGAETKFDVGRTVQLPFDTDWFGEHKSVHASSPLPKMGTIHPSYMPAILKALKALKKT